MRKILVISLVALVLSVFISTNVQASSWWNNVVEAVEDAAEGAAASVFDDTDYVKATGEVAKESDFIMEKAKLLDAKYKITINSVEEIKFDSSLDGFFNGTFGPDDKVIKIYDTKVEILISYDKAKKLCKLDALAQLDNLKQWDILKCKVNKCGDNVAKVTCKGKIQDKFMDNNRKFRLLLRDKNAWNPIITSLPKYYTKFMDISSDQADTDEGDDEITGGRDDNEGDDGDVDDAPGIVKYPNVKMPILDKDVLEAASKPPNSVVTALSKIDKMCKNNPDMDLCKTLKEDDATVDPIDAAMELIASCNEDPTQDVCVELGLNQGEPVGDVALKSDEDIIVEPADEIDEAQAADESCSLNPSAVMNPISLILFGLSLIPIVTLRRKRK